MRSAASALAVLVFCTGAAHAAAPDPTTVTVTGKRADRDSTAAKVIVKRDDLTRYGDTQLGDALKRIPSVSVTGDGAISLRGMGSGYTQVLLNGEKPPAGFSLSSLSPDMIERVEIIRTPTADMRGEAIGGTINIVLRRVVTADSRELKLSAAETDDKPQISLSGSVSGRKTHLSYILSGAVSHNESTSKSYSTRTGTDTAGVTRSIIDDQQVGGGHVDQLSLTPNLTFAGDDGATLAVQGFLQLRRQFFATTETAVARLGVPLPFAINPQSGAYDSRSTRLDFDRKQDLGDGKLALKLSLNAFHRDGLAYQRGFDLAGAKTLDSTITSVIDEHSLSTSGKYSLPALGAHTPEVGWDGGVTWHYETRIERDQPLANTPPGSLLGNSDLIFNATVRRVSVNLQDNWTLSPRWSIYLGLRDEAVETLSRGNNFALVRNRVSVVSPVVQSLWKLPDDQGQVRLGLSRTFKAPDVSELVPRPYVNANNSMFNPDGINTPDLKPELAWGLDTSYERYWKNQAMVSIGGHVRHIDDKIRYVTRFQNGRWVRGPVNGGTADAAWIELETRFSLPQLIAAAPPVDVHAGLTRSWSKMSALPPPGNILPGQVPLSVTIGLDGQFNAYWSGGLNEVFTQGSQVRDSDQQLNQSEDSHLLDAYLARTLSPQAKIRVSISNVLRRGAHDVVTFTDASGTTRSVGRGAAPATFRIVLERKY
jgi:outer membrane receptor for ferrienterochelin and colicin